MTRSVFGVVCSPHASYLGGPHEDNDDKEENNNNNDNNDNNIDEI